jgi:hypothetical protein
MATVDSVQWILPQNCVKRLQSCCVLVAAYHAIDYCFLNWSNCYSEYVYLSDIVWGMNNLLTVFFIAIFVPGLTRYDYVRPDW